MSHLIKLGFFLPLMFYSSAGFAEKLWIPGVYSNMHYIEEAGDLAGDELFIFTGCGGHCVLVQIAEGGAPFAELAPLIVKENSISFSLKGDETYGSISFSGKVTKDKIIGVLKFSNNVSNSVEYTKGKSYWQSF